MCLWLQIYCYLLQLISSIFYLNVILLRRKTRIIFVGSYCCQLLVDLVETSFYIYIRVDYIIRFENDSMYFSRFRSHKMGFWKVEVKNGRKVSGRYFAWRSFVRKSSRKSLSNYIILIDRKCPLL